jgi:predicted phosphodiesterase
MFKLFINPQKTALICLALTTLLVITNFTAAEPALFTHEPYLQNVTQNSIVVMWQTDVPTDSIVEFGLTTDYGSQVYSAALTLNHEMMLTGLDPQTLYHYRVSSDDGYQTIYSIDSTFQTAPSNEIPFTFAVFSDSQVNPDVFTQICNSAVDINPQLILHCGDFTQNCSDPEWTEVFFTPAAPLISKAPLFPSKGNHEHNGSFRYLYFDPPDGGGAYNEQWYSFDYSNAHFICLDTAADFTPGTDQYEWLVNDLRSATAEWIFVYHHHHIYCSWMPDEEVVRYLVPLYEQYAVDIVFSGHIHFYERSLKDGIYYVVCGGCGGRLNPPHCYNPYGIYQLSDFHFVTVDIDGSTAALQAHSPDGTVFDTETWSH